MFGWGTKLVDLFPQEPRVDHLGTSVIINGYGYLYMLNVGECGLVIRAQWY